MQHFRINNWVPDEWGTFVFNKRAYRIVLRFVPPHGYYIFFPDLSSNATIFRTMGFKSGQDCLQQLCPTLVNNLGGDWPYLDDMDQLRLFCMAINRWLNNKEEFKYISIY